jgi:hypothetical protein
LFIVIVGVMIPRHGGTCDAWVANSLSKA